MKQQIIWHRPSARELCFVREAVAVLQKGEQISSTGGPPSSEVVAWETGAPPGEPTRYWFIWQKDFVDGIDGWTYVDPAYPVALVDPHSIRTGEPTSEPRVFSVSRVIRKAAKARLAHFRAQRGERIRRWFDFFAWGRK